MNYSKAVWIDTDISLGQEHAPGIYKDIDDGLAMIALFNSKTVALKGVSSTFGNTIRTVPTELPQTSSADLDLTICKYFMERMALL